MTKVREFFALFGRVDLLDELLDKIVDEAS